jgi:hypothetical protein
MSFIILELAIDAPAAKAHFIRTADLFATRSESLHSALSVECCASISVQKGPFVERLARDTRAKQIFLDRKVD